MKLYRSLQVALLSAFLLNSALAQTEADVASLLSKAQRGNTIAQYRLGLAYTNGQGIPADPIEAYVWLSLAYESGFRGKALGNVAGGLSTDQLEIARQRLEERRVNLTAQPGPTASTKPITVEAEAEIPVVRTEQSSRSAQPAASPAAEQKLRMELADAVADKLQLSGELSKAWSETEELKKQLTDIQTATSKSTTQTGELRGERDTLAAKLTALSAELANFRAAQASAATDKKQLTDELAKTFQEVTALQAQLAEQQRKTAALPVAPSYPDLSGKVQQLEASVAGLSTKANAAQLEAVRLADDRIAREKQFAALQQQNAELANAHAALRQEAEAMARAAAVPVTPAYPDQRTQVATLERQVAELKTESNQTRQQVAALSEAKDTAEKSLAQIRALPTYPDLSGKVRELEASLVTATGNTDSAKQEAIRLADDRMAREKQFAALQQQHAELANAHAALRQEAEAMARAAAVPAKPTYPDLRRQVSSLEKQLAETKAETGQVRQQVAALSQAKDAAEKSLTQIRTTPTFPDLSGKVRELEAALVKSTADASSAKQEAQRLSDDRMEREKQFATLQQQNSDLANAHIALQQDAEALRRSTSTPAAPVYPDLSNKVSELEARLAAQTEAAEKSRIELQTQLAATAQPATPAYPDLSSKVQELEAALASRSDEVATANEAAAELRQAKINADQMLADSIRFRDDLAQQFDEFKRSALTNQRELTNQQAKVQMLETEKAALRQQSSADQTRLADLSSQLAAARRQATEVYPTTPAYPDLRARVEQLETELTKTNEQSAGLVALQNRTQKEVNFASNLAEQLRATNHELETKLAAAQSTSSAPAAAPDYPDLRNQVSELESALRTAKSAAPAYPDLREQVNNLEFQLEAARALPGPTISETDLKALRQELRDMQEKMATTLRGYAVLEKERDELANRPVPVATPAPAANQSRQIRELEAQLAASAAELSQARQQIAALNRTRETAAPTTASTTPAADTSDLRQELAEVEAKLSTSLRAYTVLQNERDELAAKSDRSTDGQSEISRLNEAYAALQRSTAQNERDLVAARALLQQVQGSNTVLAQQNYQLKGALALEPGAPRTLAKPSAPTPIANARTHTVAAGDTLSKISQRYYNSPNRWQEIYNANRDVIGTNGLLRIGTDLRIP